MKRIWLMGLLVIAGYISHAQKSETEAKAAYLLAEEFYGKGDYKAALDYLQQVKLNLGGSNCKILYLEIMATRELYTKDPGLADKLLPLITEFEKSSDYANFNEEKILEVSKLKLLMKGEQKAARDKLAEAKIAREKRIDSMAKARTQEYKDAFINTVKSEGQFNITLDELDKANPKWKIKKWVADKLSPTVDLYHDPAYIFNAADFPFPTILSMKGSKNPFSILGVYVRDGKVIGYQKLVTDFSLVFNGAKQAYDINAAIPAAILNNYSNAFLFDPIITPFTIAGVTANRYLWADGKYGLLIEEMHYPKGDGGIVKIVKTYFYNPTEKETATYHPAEK